MWHSACPPPRLWKRLSGRGEDASNTQIRQETETLNPGSPKSRVPAVPAGLYGFWCTTSQRGLSEWMDVVSKEEKQCHVNIFSKLDEKSEADKETLSGPSVTGQIIPHSIACHSWRSLKRDPDKAWHDGIIKWHCHSCPPGYDKCYPGLGEAALLGVSLLTSGDNMTKLLSKTSCPRLQTSPDKFCLGLH